MLVLAARGKHKEKYEERKLIVLPAIWEMPPIRLCCSQILSELDTVVGKIRSYGRSCTRHPLELFSGGPKWHPPDEYKPKSDDTAEWHEVLQYPQFQIDEPKCDTSGKRYKQNRKHDPRSDSQPTVTFDRFAKVFLD
jgi:hypothetical protein